MNYNINKINSIINHLKSISKLNTQNNELVIFCPYCDDAIRTNPDHGHCYISLSDPLFYCFRCNKSGLLLKLLIDTGYNEQEGLDYLSNFIKYNYTKNKTIIKKTNLDKLNLYDKINKEVIQFKRDNLNNYSIFINYVISRIGNVDFTNFLIYPVVFQNYIGCRFLNYNDEITTTRWINNKNIRYENQSKSKNILYYFQELDFNKYQNIILTEGCFDCINMYLYNKTITNGLYLGICGKKYISTIEYLLFNYILIGKFNIHLIFDNDNNDQKKLIFLSKKIVQNYNLDIQIYGWKPTFGKDVSDNIELTEVK